MYYRFESDCRLHFYSVTLRQGAVLALTGDGVHAGEWWNGIHGGLKIRCP